MNRSLRRTLSLSGLIAAVVAVRWRSAMRAGGPAGRPPRWHAVTVNRPEKEVAPDDRLPAPLAELGDAVEVRLRPAPGNRGTEVAARLHTELTGLRALPARLGGTDSRQALRAALRDAKQVVETGEVLRPDHPPTTRRTVAGKPLALVVRRARGEGRL